MKKSNCAIFLDGLDEAANQQEREYIAGVLRRAARDYRGCRFIVTTRPQAHVDLDQQVREQGNPVLLGFQRVRIEQLDDASIFKILDHWCRALFPETPVVAARHFAELSEALALKPEIRQMSRTPVMLTALAVVQWNEHRLPEQRSELYESILTWLARSREKRPGRESAERSLNLLSNLALGMQMDGRRHLQIEVRQAAELLAPWFADSSRDGSIHKALSFLESEEVDSGIIVSRGLEVRFWHLTFQEYLAARAIAGLPDVEQYRLLFGGDQTFSPELRETVLLLAGVLAR
jgi:predicted NACHT family NTPase